MTIRAFERPLELRLPYDRGLDVLAVQQRLRSLNLATGTPDGIYGPQTATAMRAFQTANSLPATSVCDQSTWRQLFPDAPDSSTSQLSRLVQMLLPLRRDHARFEGGARWRLVQDGLHIDGNDPQGSGGEPVTIRRIWENYGDAITSACTTYGVPAELVVATIATESSGRADAIRFEPNYASDDATPNQVSPGLMQTLISTAREALSKPDIDRAWLLVPANSIDAGTAYILKQSSQTGFDPPVAACCYNAGSVALNDSPQNRWRMRQYPIGTSVHCDRFVQWFNDCVLVFSGLPNKPPVSFAVLLTDSQR
jgi:peptidoglycan hydrolase-like protein with peptidoglycan-binding domain